MSCRDDDEGVRSTLEGLLARSIGDSRENKRRPSTPDSSTRFAIVHPQSRSLNWIQREAHRRYGCHDRRSSFHRNSASAIRNYTARNSSRSSTVNPEQVAVRASCTSSRRSGRKECGKQLERCREPFAGLSCVERRGEGGLY